MGHDSTAKTQDLLSLKQFKLNAIVEAFKTIEKREFKVMTSELGKGKSAVGQEGRSREGRWYTGRVGGNEMQSQREPIILERVWEREPDLYSHPGTFFYLARYLALEAAISSVKWGYYYLHCRAASWSQSLLLLDTK